MGEKKSYLVTYQLEAKSKDDQRPYADILENQNVLTRYVETEKNLLELSESSLDSFIKELINLPKNEKIKVLEVKETQPGQNSSNIIIGEFDKKGNLIGSRELRLEELKKRKIKTVNEIYNDKNLAVNLKGAIQCLQLEIQRLQKLPPTVELESVFEAIQEIYEPLVLAYNFEVKHRI